MRHGVRVNGLFARAHCIQDATSVNPTGCRKWQKEENVLCFNQVVAFHVGQDRFDFLVCFGLKFPTRKGIDLAKLREYTPNPFHHVEFSVL